MISLRRRLHHWAAEFAWFVHKARVNATRRKHVVDLVWEKAQSQSADFILENIGQALLHRDRRSFWRTVLARLPAEGLILEFGVFEGRSINEIADHLKQAGDRRSVYGFDAFAGLGEDWTGVGMASGAFDRAGRLPEVRGNVQLVKGWIADTLPGFLAGHAGETAALVHIDTDTYAPAKLVLEQCCEHLRPGSLVVFDEYHGYPNWQGHEHKALQEALPKSCYRFIAFAGRQAAIEITTTPPTRQAARQ